MTDIDEDIAVGTKVFYREEKLKGLLDSIPAWISTVYVADDGETSKKKSEIYGRSYSFDLEVIDLEYDVGIGAGRNAIVDTMEEEYIFIVDPDHRIPPTAPLLIHQLKANPKIGGIGGLLYEPENQQLYSQAQDFREEQRGNETVLVRETKTNNKKFKTEAGAPLVEWDWIPNATLFRRKCLQEQAWDPKFVNNYEHVDFYISHWKNTDWKFAVSPSVQFVHFPGGDTHYMSHRHDPEAKSETKKYLLTKWSFDSMEWPEQKWIEVSSQSRFSKNVQNAFQILREEGPFALGRQVQQFIRNQI
jgi:hypothetical protein